jgi:hypothetical protein
MDVSGEAPWQAAGEQEQTDAAKSRLTSLRPDRTLRHLLPKVSSFLRSGIGSVECSGFPRVDIPTLRDVLYGPEVAVINYPCVQTPTCPCWGLIGGLDYRGDSTATAGRLSCSSKAIVLSYWQRRALAVAAELE